MEEHCVACGAIIPEGRQVCPMCEKGVIEWYQLQLSSKSVKSRLTKDGAIFYLGAMGYCLDGSQAESRYP